MEEKEYNMTIRLSVTSLNEIRVDVAYPDGYAGLAFYADPVLAKVYIEECVDEYFDGWEDDDEH